MSELKRIDPKNCGCTDCITGYSQPIDFCSQDELKQLFIGELINASGYDLDVTVNYEDDDNA